MKLNKFTVIMAVLLMAILAIGAVSAESIDDADDSIAIDDGDSDIQLSDSPAEDLSAADTADETVGDDDSGPDDTVEYDLDDDTYSTYFNDDGTATDALSADGNYNLNVGTLTNKDIKILSGQNIYIIGKEGAGVINNGTLTIGSGAINEIDTVQVSGITFINTNKNPIVVNQYAKSVAIANNNFDLTYDDTYMDNAIAIMTKGLVEDVFIVSNDIKMTSAASYTYGLDLTYYLDWYTYADGNAKNFFLANNAIDIVSTAQTGMAEAMYLDSIIDSVITGNNIHVKTTNPGVSNYGMQVPDSWGFFNDPWASSAYNVTIKDNTVVLDAADLAYGISAISLWGYDEEYDEIVKDIVISGNDVTITTQTEGVGISATSSDVSITDNNVVLNAAHDPVQAYTDSYIGNVSYGILVNNFNSNMGNYVNNTVTGNTISSNVESIKATKEDDAVQPLTIEDNEVSTSYLITDDTYATYFNDDGTIKDDAPISEGDSLVLGELNNKKFVVDVPLNIKGNGNKQTNTTISLISGADGTLISGLDMYYEDDGSAVFAVIAVNNGVSDVVIADNTITTVSASSWNYDMAISVYGAPEGSKNIKISGNTITMSGDAGGLYGIDVQNYDPYWNKGQGTTGLNISSNTISIVGSGMVEPIYVSNSNDILIYGNKITSSSTGGDAYAIGTSTNNNFTVKGNVMDVTSENNMAYGVASPDSKDVVINDNQITATGVGAVGIGFVNDENVEVGGNIISITGGDYTTVRTYEKVGAANAAILDKSGNTGVVIGENTITENIPLTIDDSNYATYFNEDGTIKDDAPISENDLIFLGELNNKKIVLDVPLTIKGNGNKQTNTTISLISGADGTAISGLDMYYEDDGSAVFAIIAVNNGVSDVVIADNTITTVSASSWNYDMAISVYGAPEGSKNIAITGNTITMTGGASGLYGIDVQNYDPYWNKGQGTTGLNISDNTINIAGSGMVEPIYVSNSNDILIDGNKITSSSTGGDAYAIGTSENNNFTVTNNAMDVTSENNMAYGVASPNSKDVVINNNNITATGVGAVGVGFVNDENVEVDGNIISITGGDYTTVRTYEKVGAANAAILNRGESTENLNVGENTLTENGKETDIIKTGDGSKDLQAIIDAAPAGSTVDLTGQYFTDVANVEINKDITITGGSIVGKEGEPIFVLPAKSEGGPSEFTLTDSTIKVNNANTIVKATADNDTNPTAIDTANINIKNNNIELANDDVVPESVTVLELDSERPVLAPTGEIAVSGNTLAAGVDPFDFKVTSVNTDDGTVVPAGPINAPRTETQIVYQNMSTTAVDVDTDGRVGKYFYITLKDKNNNLLKNKPVQIGFNGNVYDRVTDDKGQARLQINLKNAGTYTFAVSYLGDDVYNGSFVVAKIVVSKQKGSLTVPAKSYKASATKTLTATFKAASGKVVSGKKITFTVNGKSYSATTNAKGVATVKVSLSTKGTYSFTAKFAGNNMYAAISKTAKLTIK